MDASISVRGVQPVQIPTTRADAPPVSGQAPTILPAQSTVGASTGSERPTNNNNQPRSFAELITDNVRRQLQREVEINDATEELVYKSVDPSTGETISQFPTEAALKLRAYVDSIFDENNAPDTLSKSA
jgi:uncharacterized FlaG/YvyC family protein